jgi:hypothetical protein
MEWSGTMSIIVGVVIIVATIRWGWLRRNKDGSANDSWTGDDRRPPDRRP